jgi:hypothetical protein
MRTTKVRPPDATIEYVWMQELRTSKSAISVAGDVGKDRTKRSKIRVILANPRDNPTTSEFTATIQCQHCTYVCSRLDRFKLE